MDEAYSPSTQPGETETTRIAGASALARERVIESTAAFDAQYATLLPSPVTAAIEETLMTTPPSPAASIVWNARTVANEPRQLTRKMRSINSSSSASRSACGTGLVTPAALIKISSRPYVAATSEASSATWADSSTQVRTARCPTPGIDAASASARSKRSATQTTTLAPSVANRRQIAEPIPPPPPVTTATRPARSITERESRTGAHGDRPVPCGPKNVRWRTGATRRSR